MRMHLDEMAGDKRKQVYSKNTVGARRRMYYMYGTEKTLRQPREGSREERRQRVKRL